MEVHDCVKENKNCNCEADQCLFFVLAARIGVFISMGCLSWTWYSHHITFMCNIYPLIPHFYIAKLGYAGAYLFSLCLLQNIDCGYSLEPARRLFHIFVAGHVFVMFV